MNKKYLMLIAAMLVAGLVIASACLSGSTDETSETSESTETTKKSPIEEVDFKNFKYSVMKEDGKTGDIELKDGKAEKSEGGESAALGNVQYAELTGDDKDEAIVNLTVGEEKEKTEVVYVFTLEDDAPKMLWSFDGKAVKSISSEKGMLLVEHMGDAKFEEGAFKVSESEDKEKVTKTGLKWNGKEFAPEAEGESGETESQT